MKKLSPAYRHDSYEGLPVDVKMYLDEHFLSTLKNRTALNPKLLVVFSGGNAVGKSTLSQKIASELHGVVIENDAVKVHLLNFRPDIDRDELQLLTWRYTMDLYTRIGKEIENGLIVRDGVIDWYYDRILPLFEEQGYSLFIIGYNLSEQKNIELIRSRGDKQTVSAERLITQLNDHAIHQRRFRAVYQPDILLDDTNIFDHHLVIDMLRRKLEYLNQN
jgi:hypothetical protein